MSYPRNMEVASTINHSPFVVRSSTTAWVSLTPTTTPAIPYLLETELLPCPWWTWRTRECETTSTDFSPSKSSQERRSSRAIIYIPSRPSRSITQQFGRHRFAAAHVLWMHCSTRHRTKTYDIGGGAKWASNSTRTEGLLTIQPLWAHTLYRFVR